MTHTKLKFLTQTQAKIILLCTYDYINIYNIFLTHSLTPPPPSSAPPLDVFYKNETLIKQLVHHFTLWSGNNPPHCISFRLVTRSLSSTIHHITVLQCTAVEREKNSDNTNCRTCNKLSYSPACNKLDMRVIQYIPHKFYKLLSLSKQWIQVGILI